MGALFVWCWPEINRGKGAGWNVIPSGAKWSPRGRTAEAGPGAETFPKSAEAGTRLLFWEWQAPALPQIP